jgi:hypothetical protein
MLKRIVIGTVCVSIVCLLGFLGLACRPAIAPSTFRPNRVFRTTW